jgi:hypothetical protein
LNAILDVSPGRPRFEFDRGESKFGGGSEENVCAGESNGGRPSFEREGESNCGGSEEKVREGESKCRGMAENVCGTEPRFEPDANSSCAFEDEAVTKGCDEEVDSVDIDVDENPTVSCTPIPPPFLLPPPTPPTLPVLSTPRYPPTSPPSSLNPDVGGGGLNAG